MQGKKGIVAVALLLVAILGVAGVAYAVLGNTTSAGTPISSVSASATDASDNDAETSAVSTSEDAATNAADAEEATGASVLKLADFSVLDRDGNDIKLSSVYGKPALVGFWATWCPPCNAEAPELQKLFEEYGDRINFMMIDSASDGRDTAEIAYAWADEGGYTYPIYIDETGEAATAGQIYYLPTMYVLDAEGNVLTAFSGTIDETSGKQLIEQLLAL